MPSADETKSASPAAARRRRRGAEAVADLLVDVLKPVARRRGFASADLFRHWPEIVGPAYADVTRPERLSWPKSLADGGEAGFEPATLTVRCEGSRALLFQHETPLILERINAFFGFPAVGRLRLVQRPVVRPARPVVPRLRPLGAAEESRIAAATAEIADEGLRSALVRLGRAVLGSRPA